MKRQIGLMLPYGGIRRRPYVNLIASQNWHGFTINRLRVALEYFITCLWPVRERARARCLIRV